MMEELRKPTVEPALERCEDGSLQFIADGVPIEWPLLSTCARFPVDPSFYGFEVYGTGGGCTAWRREFTLDGRPVFMLLTNDLSHEIDDCDEIEVGVYDPEADTSEAVVAWTLRLAGDRNPDKLAEAHSICRGKE